MKPFLESGEKPTWKDRDSDENYWRSAYFLTKKDAEAHQEKHGGFVIETTPGKIWAVKIQVDKEGNRI
jgi:hypothetical protein